LPISCCHYYGSIAFAIAKELQQKSTKLIIDGWMKNNINMTLKQ
jgi:hypothetical protein